MVTEVNSDIANLEVNGLTQSSDSGWSILTTETGGVNFTGAALLSGTGSFLVDSAELISNSTAGIITLNGDGNITLKAVSSIDLFANVSTAGGDIYMDSGDSINMDSLITLSAAGGDAFIAATNDVGVAQILSTLASVRISAVSGSILRSASDGRRNIIATNLQLSAGTQIGRLGSTSDALIVEVDRMAATATNGVIAIDSVNDLSIGSITVNTDSVDIDKNTSTETWTMSQLISSSGNVVLRGQGSLILESITTGNTVDVNGNLLMSSVNDFTINGDVNLLGGSSEFQSSGAFILNGDLNLAGTGSLLIGASQAFTQAANSSLQTTDLNAVIYSFDGLNISNINTGSGDLALTASGSISALEIAPATQITANYILSLIHI